MSYSQRFAGWLRRFSETLRKKERTLEACCCLNAAEHIEEQQRRIAELEKRVALLIDDLDLRQAEAERLEDKSWARFEAEMKRLMARRNDGNASD